MKPKNLSMSEAAALPLSVITAWEGLVDRAKVRSGQKVLVHAGAGGVGHIAVQLARAMGAEVFATVSSEKAEIVKRLGATPIDYRRSSVEEYVAAHTERQGLRRRLRYGRWRDAGCLVYCGQTLYRSCGQFFGMGYSLLGAPLLPCSKLFRCVHAFPLISGEARAHHGEILAEAAALAEASKLKPLIHEEHFSPSELEAAFALVASGSLGKVVIEMRSLA